MSFLRGLQGLVGVLQGLLGKLMPSQVILFPVVSGGSTVRMSSEFVELRSSLMRIIWHANFCPRPPES